MIFAVYATGSYIGIIGSPLRRSGRQCHPAGGPRMALVGFRPIGHLKRRDEMVGRLGGPAGMDTQRLIRLGGRQRRDDKPGEGSRSVMSLKGLCAIGARSGTGRAMPRLPGGGDTPQRSEMGTPIRFRSDVASRPWSAIVEYGASGPLALIEEPTPILRPFAPRRRNSKWVIVIERRGCRGADSATIVVWRKWEFDSGYEAHVCGSCRGNASTRAGVGRRRHRASWLLRRWALRGLRSGGSKEGNSRKASHHSKEDRSRTAGDC